MAGNSTGGRLAVVLKNRTNPAYGGVIHGATVTAVRLGWSVDSHAAAVPDDVDEQIAIVEALIAERPDAIAMLPAHHTALNPSIEAIRQAGIPLVLFVSRPDGMGPDSYVTYVSSDDYRMALDVGRLLARRVASGEVAIIEGHPNALSTPPRTRAYRDAIAEVPGLRLVDSRPGYFQQAPAREAALEVLARWPDLRAFFIANDLMGMGVLQALDETGRKAELVSINGTPDAVAEVRKGRLVATAVFNTMKFGCLSAEAAVRHARGEQVPREILLAPTIVDRGNLDGWDLPYERRALPVWEDELAAAGV